MGVTLHESVCDQMAKGWKAEPVGAELLETAERQIRGHFWSREYRDAIGQPFGGWTSAQVAAFAYIHAAIDHGQIGRVMIQTDGTPARDREREDNAAGLCNLPEPFEAWVNAKQNNSSSGDGLLEWAEPVEIEVGVRGGGTKTVTIQPGRAPLEIGSTQASRTLLHLLEGRTVARWPYGHDWITLFMAVEQPFLNPATLLAEQLRSRSA